MITNSPRRLFLETTVQVERVLGDATRRRELAAWLGDVPLVTSSFVWMEFSRTVLQAVAYVRHIIGILRQEGRSTISFSDLARRLSETKTLHFMPRAQQRMWRVYALLMEEFQTTHVDSLLLLAAVERMMEWELPRRFYEGVEEVILRPDCDLVKPDAAFGDYVRRRMSCNATTARCDLVALLSAHRDDLRNLENAMQNAPPEIVDPSLLAALGRVMDEPSRALGERTCWLLGDVIIALTVPDDASVCTTDRLFGLLCQTLGRPLFPR
jgi:hypothetical protein